MRKSELFGDQMNQEAGNSFQSYDESLSGTSEINEMYDEWISSLPTIGEDEEWIRKSTEFSDLKFEEAKQMASKIDYSEQDLYTFLMSDWQKEWQDDFGNNDISPGVDQGIFPTALVEEMDSEEVKVPDLSDVSGFGYRATKDVIVEGDAGNRFGLMMESARARVKGDTPHNLGHTMREDAEIYVEGNCGGVWTPDGKIVIEGDIKKDGDLKGSAYGVEGTLIVEGDVEEISGDDRYEHGGEIKVDGEIGEVLEEDVSGITVYQKQDGEYVQVFPE